MRTDFSFKSSDDMEIHAHKWYHESIQPKAVLVVAHGMAETIFRYESFFDYLNDHGFICYGHSHRGHGKTAGEVSKMGYLGASGWQGMVEDLNTMIVTAKSENPTLPLVLFGHSMGSFVVRSYMTQGDDVDAIVLSGTGFPTTIELRGASWIASMEMRLTGKDLPSHRLNQLSFGKFNKGIPHAKTSFDWLTRDSEFVSRYIDDPHCGNVHPSSFFLQMSKGLLKSLYEDKPKHVGKELPLLIVSGEDDPVGNYGKAVEKAFKYYKKFPFSVMMKMYPEARHELLNELNRMEVIKDIHNWMEEAIAQ